MDLIARLITPQTGVGYQFFDATGTLIDSRVTTGILPLPETGAYIAGGVTVPELAAGVFWSSDDPSVQATESLGGGGLSSEVIQKLEDADTIALLETYVPTPGPSIIMPAPAIDLDDCVLYVSTQEIDNTITPGVEFRVKLSGPARTSNGIALGWGNYRRLVTGQDGTGTMTIERTDAMFPAGRTYHVLCEEYGVDRHIVVAAGSINLATLIPPVE